MFWLYNISKSIQIRVCNKLQFTSLSKGIKETEGSRLSDGNIFYSYNQ